MLSRPRVITHCLAYMLLQFALPARHCKLSHPCVNTRCLTSALLQFTLHARYFTLSHLFVSTCCQTSGLLHFALHTCFLQLAFHMPPYPRVILHRPYLCIITYFLTRAQTLVSITYRCTRRSVEFSRSKALVIAYSTLFQSVASFCLFVSFLFFDLSLMFIIFCLTVFPFPSYTWFCLLRCLLIYLKQIVFACFCHT